MKIEEDHGAFFGCGRKLRPRPLRDAARAVGGATNSRLPGVRGLKQVSDAGQVRLSDGSLLVQTVDEVYPLPVSPEVWGQAVTLHCLSDLYHGCGGSPLYATGVIGAGSPTGAEWDRLMIAYRAAIRTLNDEGVPLIGGHSVNQLPGHANRISFTITGTSTERDVRMFANAKVDDHLYLTKPIGTNALLAEAVSRGITDVATEDSLRDCVTWLTTSNRTASDLAARFAVSCASDVSGYGLLGTCLQLASQSDVSVEIESANVPVIEGAYEAIASGFVSGLAEDVWQDSLSRIVSTADIATMLLLADPQVSGGLVIAVGEPIKSEFDQTLTGLGCRAVEFGRVVRRRGTEHVVVH